VHSSTLYLITANDMFNMHNIKMYIDQKSIVWRT